MCTPAVPRELRREGSGNDLPVVTSSIGDTRAYHTLSAVGSWYSSYFMVGDLAEVILFDGALTEAARERVEGSLRYKYNLL